jgi:hypothetical protein
MKQNLNGRNKWHADDWLTNVVMIAEGFIDASSFQVRTGERFAVSHCAVALIRVAHRAERLGLCRKPKLALRRWKVSACFERTVLAYTIKPKIP